MTKCDRATCTEEAEMRVFWPEAAPVVLCMGHFLMTLDAAEQAGVRLPAVSLGSMFEDLLLWRMVRGNEQVDSRKG